MMAKSLALDASRCRPRLAGERPGISLAEVATHVGQVLGLLAQHGEAALFDGTTS